MSECDNSLTTMDWLSAVDVKIAPAKSDFLESSLSLTSPPSSSKDPFEDFRPMERETGKPSHSYSTLIKYAISSTRSKRMSLRQIYKWISDTFPYYKDARNGWKNSIRHNLSLNKCFIKVPREQGDIGKGCYWSLRDAVQHAERTSANLGSRQPTVITVASSVNAVPHQHGAPVVSGIISGNGSFANQAKQLPQPTQPPTQASIVPQQNMDGIPELTDSAVGALAALMSSQSDQLLGAAFAPVTQGPSQAASASGQLGQPDSAPCLTPPAQPLSLQQPPLSPPSAAAADQLSLSASLQTICRSLLGESSSGASGIGAFATVETGGSSSGSSVNAGGGGAGAAVSGSSGFQAPDLSASTLDFVQRMLPQLKDSFQLSESAVHDLWDNCRSASRPATVTDAGHPGGVIPLPTLTENRRHQAARPALPPLPPPPRWSRQPPPPAQQQHQPPQPRTAQDSGQEVEDEFNWDSIL